MSRYERQRIMQRRRALLNLRKRIKPARRFRVEFVEVGKFKYTCTTCGRAEIKELPGNRSETWQRKFAAYQDQGSGVYGHCKRCTKAARDERYPLPKLPPKEET